MDIVKTNISHNLNIERYFPNDNICFLDIETTGLNRNKNIIYLIGILYYDTDTWILKQYFANSFDEEKDILEKFLSDITAFNKIITYNGESFDLPFIKHKLEKFKLNNSFANVGSIDLYQFIKGNKLFLDLPNLKLKTIEQALGFEREDIYSGLDCINFYLDFIKTNNLTLKENILKHNYDDLAHMLDIISIIDYIDDKKSFYINFNRKNIKFKLEQIEASKNILNIKGNIYPDLERNLRYYGKNFNLITEDKNRFSLSIEYNLGLITREEKCKYIDVLEFNVLDNLKNSLELNLPPNILILSIENKYCMNNIKRLTEEIIKSLLL